ncbi:MAG: glycoside hydrolase family 172 protein [Bacteroidales bacterium]|nr:glycoside hydrolase family 172 protein [Bacteroidales bacterium]
MVSLLPRSVRIKALRILALATGLFLLTFCTGKQPVTFHSLMTEMTDRQELSKYPETPYKLKQFSSYDRRSVAPGEEGWFANADYTQFIREEENEGRREFVLFDHEGPGAIVRWWMTFAGEGSHEGTVRIYLDNNENPFVEAGILEVLSGQFLTGEPLSSSVSPESDYYRRGHNLYLPIPYAAGCKITYECDAIEISENRRSPSVYYNISYRDYEDDARLATLTMETLREAGSLMEEVNRTLMEPGDMASEPVTLSGDILPGSSISYSTGKGRQAINRISMSIDAENINQALRSTVLEISFDGNTTVWVPAGDFFGTGHELHTYDTWFTRVNETGTMQSDWIMPFREKADIHVHNFSGDTVNIEMQIFFEPYRWTGKSMYFGSSWHEYHNIKTAGAENVGGTGKHRDINYIDIEGKGLYSGDAVTVYNTTDAWWGEGDEKIFVDNEDFPSSIGTGTEDYYGYAWCRPEEFSHPFIAQPTGAGNFHPGMTVNMRYRMLDAIPFNENISSNIELWHWTPAVINYALTSYYYIFPGAMINISPDEEAVSKVVARERADIVKPAVNDEGIVEGEFLDVMALEGGTAETQYITGWDWSNKGQLWWRNGETGDKLMTRFIVPETGQYMVSARLSRARDYGIVSFEINARRAGIDFNGYTDGEEVVEVPLGRHILPEGDNILTIEIKGSDSRALPGNMAGIDYLKLIKQ